MIKKELTEKDKAIKKEISRLKRILKELDKNKRDSAEGLIQEAAFMRATLQELKKSIDKNGPIDEMPQGKYSILREHPALKSYNTMIQRYTTVCKEIFNLLPKEVQKVEDDGFDDFVINK
ncbi:P27 family phage terminase small subunit [Crassaminicella thermophila]|uniref:P27 family phage terminase small subunit n=1 Tax=Crassaminicella thermophila TaxID=2599308 RepID=UPI001E3884E1|nr:P27 family phage terminase small subunit [Crassaminicella thermophila]